MTAIAECWVAEDSLPSAREQRWLNVVLGKKVSCKRGFEIYVQGNRRKNPPRLRRTFDIKSILFYVMALDNSFSSRVDFQRIPFLKQKQYCFLLSDGQVP